MGEVYQWREDLMQPIHGHCMKCVSVNCKVLPITDHSCPMVSCPANCKAKFHRCKMDDHRNLCPNEMVLCLNHWNGCKTRMPRFSAKKHLKVCPSSHRGYSIDFKFVNFYVALKKYEEDKANKDLTASETIHDKISNAIELGVNSLSEMSDANEPDHTGDSSQSDMSYANESVDTAASSQSEMCDANGSAHSDAGSNIYDESCIFRKSLWVVPWQVQQSPENDQFVIIHHPNCKCGRPSTQEMAPDMLPCEEAPAYVPGFYMDALPYMTLRKIAGFLDAEALRNLSLVSHRMRLVCASWLQTKGSVAVVWEKKNGSWVDSKRIWKF